MHPANQRLRKPGKLSQGVHNQTSYPRVQWKNTLDKREEEGREQPRCRDREQGNIRSRNNQEHRTTHAAGSYEQGIRHRISQELGTIAHKGIITKTGSL